MTSPGVSIVIDSYNHAAFVGEAVASALAQNYPNFEVIVVDDGSTDKSAEVIRSFLPEIDFFEQANQGQVACCRRGFAHARFDIVIFLDSDDRLHPGALKRVGELWSADTAKIQWALNVIDGDGRSVGTRFPRYPKQLPPKSVFQSVRMSGSYPDSPTSGNAYSRKLLDAILPILPRPNGIDGELNGAAPLFGDVLTIADVLGDYRVHAGNQHSMDRLDRERFERYCRHSEARFAFVRSVWSQFDQNVPALAIRRDLKYLEYDLVRRRLAPKDAGKIGQTLLDAARASWYSKERPFSRLVRVLWMGLLAFSPSSQVHRLIEQRYVPARRWSWLRQI